MKRNGESALTFIELLVVALIALLVALLFPALAKTGSKTLRICQSNLKQIGLGFQLFAMDHGQRFPMQVSTNEGGSLEFVAAADVFPHFQTLSNSGHPGMFHCISDTNRSRTGGWEGMNDGNISYFLGMNSQFGEPDSILAGDRTLAVVGLQRGNELFLSRNTMIEWNPNSHRVPTGFRKRLGGNFVFADGSVKLLHARELQRTVQASVPLTNRLVFP